MERNEKGAPICETDEEFSREYKKYNRFLFFCSCFGTFSTYLPFCLALLMFVQGRYMWALFECFVVIYSLKMVPSLEQVFVLRPIRKQDGNEKGGKWHTKQMM